MSSRIIRKNQIITGVREKWMQLKKLLKPIQEKRILHKGQEHKISIIQRKKIMLHLKGKKIRMNLTAEIPKKFQKLPQFKNKKKGHYTILLKENNEAIGFVSRFHSFLPPKYRGTGLAEKLLRELEKIEKKLGTKLFVDGGLTLQRIKFLIKQGYAPTKET